MQTYTLIVLYLDLTKCYCLRRNLLRLHHNASKSLGRISHKFFDTAKDV